MGAVEVRFPVPKFSLMLAYALTVTLSHKQGTIDRAQIHKGWNMRATVQ